MDRSPIKRKTIRQKFGDDNFKRVSYHKYKKMLRKEGLQNKVGVCKQNNDKACKKQEKEIKKREHQKKGTNRLIQTYEKSKAGRKSKKEFLKERAERDRIRSKKKKFKKEQHQKLSKWTKKGQPVMKNKMEVMLDKIINNKDTYLS